MPTGVDTIPAKRMPFYKSLGGRLLAALALVALVSVGGLGLAAYLNERAALEAQVAAQLTSVADLKKEQIITWLEERQADVRLLAVNKLNQEHFTELLSPEVSLDRKTEFAAFLADNLIGMQQSRPGYNEITFVDAGGMVVLSTEPALVGQPTQHQVIFAETLAAPEGAFIQDIHFDPQTGLIEMAFGHIINAVDLDTGEEVSEVIGVAFIIVNMDETIYPLIRAWPGMGGTGETLLIRAEGDHTLFLNNLRFNEAAALKLSVSTDSPNAKPAHHASRGGEDIIQTPDYRGVPVLAAYRHIPGIGWGFVAKEDLNEAFAPVNVLAFRIGLVATAVLLAAGLLSVVISRTLTRPLTQLVEGTHAVAGGDLTTKINVVREDEIGTLAGSFNHMTVQLRQTLEGLEQHVVELKQTQTALRESEEKFRSLLESASEGIVVVNSDSEIELVNAQVELIFGYPRAELLGQSIEILLPRRFRAAHVEHRADYRARPHARPMGPDLELVGRRKDGSEFPVEVGLSFIETKAGMLVMSFIMDITERKRTDEALRKSEAEFRELYQEAPYAYFSVGIDRRIKMANQRAVELLGYPLDALIGCPVLDLYADTPAGKEKAQKLFLRFLAGENIQDEEMEMRRADGTLVSVQLTARLIKDAAGQVVSSRSMVVDITARKQHEHELEVIASMTTALRDVITRGDMLPIILDKLLDLLSVEDAALDMYDPVSGGTVLELGRGAWANSVGARTPPGEGVSGHVLTTEQIYFNNQGQTGPRLVGPDLPGDLQAVACVPLIVQEQPIGVLWVGRNNEITPDEVQLLTSIGDIAANALHRARLFEELQRSNEALAQERISLAQRVQKRTAELSAANTELAQAARLKDEFLANMSHELRTPLNTILGMSEVLCNEVYGPLNLEQLNAVGHVEEAGRHLLGLITDILDLSKIGADKLELTLNAVPVSDVCQASLLFIKQLAHKKQIKISSDIDIEVDALRVDERRLKQILVNLLTNAVKFTPAGGQVGLKVEGDRAAGVARFTVWDRGIGIAEEDMDRLFKPFVQIDSSLSRQYEGTGLGLALVSRLTDMHGGSLTLDSQVSQGSRFTVSLPWNVDMPVSEDEKINDSAFLSPPAAPPSSVIPSFTNANPLILLAEDNQANIATLSSFLQAMGYQFVIAQNGIEAIDQAREQKPDLILMDIQMPEMDGLEATRRLRNETDLAKIPIIALTALAMPGDRERCLAAGVDEYLSKPVSFAKLTKTIEMQLQRVNDERQKTTG